MDVVRTRRTLYIAVAAGLLGATALAASSCSSKSGGTFSSGDDGSVAGDDGGGGTSSSGGGTGSSSGLNLGGSGGGTGNGICKDGTYSGTYECSFILDQSADGGGDAGFDDAGFLITGNISFQLTQDPSSGESFVDKASGNFGGSCCGGLFTLDAGVSGQLNCNSGVFDGLLSNGGYYFLALPGATGPANGSFSGPLDSKYGPDDAGTYSFLNGTWNLTVPGQGYCPGIWSAQLQ
jgi:hypothetical protein